jgi:hypothetical protein
MSALPTISIPLGKGGRTLWKFKSHSSPALVSILNFTNVFLIAAGDTTRCFAKLQIVESEWGFGEVGANQLIHHKQVVLQWKVWFIELKLIFYFCVKIPLDPI